MSTKTAKVLHVIAFILIVLTMAFVLVGWLAFKNELMTLVQSTEEYMQAEFTPWLLIIEVGFVLLLALIWLIVLLNRPGRGATIAMTIIMSILLIGFYAVGKPFLNVWLQQKAAEGEGGVYVLAALSQFNYAAGTLANFAFIPGLFLMVLSLGSACGKNFKKQTEEPEQPEQEQPVYEQRSGAQPSQYGQQPGMQRPQYGQQPGYQQYGQQPNYQQYGQRPQMQNTGYIPKMDAMQNTGYIPKVDAMQNTGYIPKVDVPQNTGYIPKVEATQNTGYIPKVETPQNMGTLPPVDSLAHKTGAIPQVSYSKPTQTPSSPIIYPWMKAAGAPKEESPEAEVQSGLDAEEKLENDFEDVLTEEVPSVELPEEAAAELPEEILEH